ncbi:MAG: gliding motility-associated C-terminal domain-containing protein, partial [Bacteroidaceae bacterium]|nr:gliding motility-associated C-terminal domain-containing protein [Bacteroidaceae bacterium]
MKRTLLYILLLSAPLFAMAQNLPKVEPLQHYVTAKGEEIEEATEPQEAPLKATFSANPSDVGDYSARYEWKIWKDGDKENLIVHRFEETLDYTFEQSGSFVIQLYATFVNGQDTITYPSIDFPLDPFSVTISESVLEFPNAMSRQTMLKAKSGYKSIVRFEAAVFNRNGRKLFSWNNPADGWDGKVNGSWVPDGAYFLVVNATGADGRQYK